jgi:hypothetical protein
MASIRLLRHSQETLPGTMYDKASNGQWRGLSVPGFDRRAQSCHHSKKTRKHRGDTFESDVPRFASARLTKARRAMHEKYVQSGMNFSFDRNGRND